jgi:hypothetical protein
MNNKKVISFEPTSTECGPVIPAPIPSSEMLPPWYKGMNKIVEPRTISGGRLNKTVKACMPFLDSLTAGYMLTTSCEIRFDVDGRGGFDYEIANAPHPFVVRENYSAPIPDEYYQVEFAWQTYWQAHTSVGSSSLFVHPLNRPDLPFYTTSGIVDTDQGMFVGTGSMPFYVKKGFVGIIPIGTPFAQIIPFERSSWESRVLPFSSEPLTHRMHRVTKYLTGGYGKEIRQKKSWK